MTNTESITIDQLLVFTAIVDEGSFSAAGRRLRRAQSAISYAIAALEATLGVTLFDRSVRPPVPSDAGWSLLVEARTVLRQVGHLRGRARSMAEGVEARLGLACDVMFPMDVMIDALRDLMTEFPACQLALRTEALGAVDQLVLDDICQLGVSGPLFSHRELVRRPLAEVELVVVAAPDHPLARARSPIAHARLRAHVQLVVTDRSHLTEGIDRGVVADRTWRIVDLSTKQLLLVGGFGWGTMPRHMIIDDLAAGRLVELRLAEWDPSAYVVPLFAIHRESAPPGPAGRWLLNRLSEGLGLNGDT